MIWPWVRYLFSFDPLLLFCCRIHVFKVWTELNRICLPKTLFHTWKVMVVKQINVTDTEENHQGLGINMHITSFILSFIHLISVVSALSGLVIVLVPLLEFQWTLKKWLCFVNYLRLLSSYMSWNINYPMQIFCKTWALLLYYRIYWLLIYHLLNLGVSEFLSIMLINISDCNVVLLTATCFFFLFGVFLCNYPPRKRSPWETLIVSLM